MDGIGNAGGIQEMTIKWMQNINHKNITIDILSYNHVKKDNFKERVHALGGEIFLVESFQDKGMFFKSLKQTWNFFAEHNDYQILHAHSSSKAFFILAIARHFGIKTRILHSHCTKFVVTNKIPLLIANILKIPTRSLATDYFACSPEAGSFLFGEKAVLKGLVYIAHNGIDTDVFRPKMAIRTQMRDEFTHGEDLFLIGNVGRFRPQKNHTFLLDIFKEVTLLDQTARLLCVGNGELEDDIKCKAKQLGIYDKILFLGFRDDVENVMQAFDLLLMPSLFEGLPVTGVEAQAIGVPALFATTITKDAAILPTSSFMSLSDTPKVWANKIVSYRNAQREEEPHNWIKKRNYDIKIETKKLSDFYNAKS